MSRIRRTSAPPTPINPLTRVSKHFLLSDFLGNHSVYSRGLANPMIRDQASLLKMDNLGALCTHALEPIVEEYGPVSVAYGYISPEVSREVVQYQDPDKPSHHRFDLGAAADIKVHRWVDKSRVRLEDLFLPPSAHGAPIALAHGIDQMEIPYSRIITYSESPYICIAVSSTEVGRRQPRKAFYENRYQGQKGAKPEYIQLMSEGARNRHFAQLQEQGLERDWEGAGHPTYHGGGRRQYQHMPVSKYTVVSDWLFDLQSIANGEKNIPALNLESVQDAFAAAGYVYDWIIDNMGVQRCSIVGGYVSHLNPLRHPINDWRLPFIQFHIVPPADVDRAEFVDRFNATRPEGGGAEATNNADCIVIDVEVENVLTEWP